MTRIPKRYIEIRREKEKPTAYIQDKKGFMRGRIERGDKQQMKQIKKHNWNVGQYGNTRVIRMSEDFGTFRAGQVIARTKKIYPNQPNTTLIRGSDGSIKSISVSSHQRSSKYGRRHNVRNYRRSL